MKIHEYQAKELLRAHGVPVPRGYPAFNIREAQEAAQKLGGAVWVVKAQIHAGGRGKGGGVKLARSQAEVETLAGQILGMQLKTHQTGPEGQKVRRLLVEDGAVVGVQYDLDGVAHRLMARRGVILATGGFEWNADLARCFLKGPIAFPASPPTNMGDGLTMLIGQADLAFTLFFHAPAPREHDAELRALLTA